MSEPRKVICEISHSEDESESEYNPEEFSASEFRKSLPVGSCFFCDTTYECNPDAVECVLSHMTNRHNFTLPYPEKLVDARGLLANLGRLVGEEFACLGCGRQFLGRRQDRHKKSPAELRKEALSAVRKHMIDKEHNFLYTGVEDPVMVFVAIAESGDNETVVPPIARVGGELYSQYYSGDQANKTLVLVCSMFMDSRSLLSRLVIFSPVQRTSLRSKRFMRSICPLVELSVTDATSRQFSVKIHTPT